MIFCFMVLKNKLSGVRSGSFDKPPAVKRKDSEGGRSR